ncbi:hypothetical protein AB0H71_04270 [Nocardia sp. NPDC050697]|uniref:hypothetical protein n=1 Tax=Nocardia sp. NPDC050697 TaxID=3155158 RepID=UPI0033C4E69C
MRSGDEVKAWWLEMFGDLLARPEMFARSGREMEAVAGWRLRDLCYLDEREEEFEKVRRELLRYGQFGVHGPFAAIFGEQHSCTAEVASIYAEQFHRLGYLKVARLEWDSSRSVREWVGEGDVRRSDVLAAFGEPGLRVGSRVLCYAPADGSGWVFFDCAHDELVRRYVPGKGTYENERPPDDPLIRDVRIPAGTFEERLILPLYGRVQRWGVGWWIHHPR